MSVVELRCVKCRRVLKTIDAWKKELTENDAEFRRCQKCDVPSPGDLVETLIRTSRDGLHLAASVPLTDLKRAARRARKANRRETIDVRVIDSGRQGEVS